MDERTVIDDGRRSGAGDDRTRYDGDRRGPGRDERDGDDRTSVRDDRTRYGGGPGRDDRSGAGAGRRREGGDSERRAIRFDRNDDDRYDDDDRYGREGRYGRDDRDDRDERYDRDDPADRDARYGRGARGPRSDAGSRDESWDRHGTGRRDSGDDRRGGRRGRRRDRDDERGYRDHRLVDLYAEVFATILSFRAASNLERPDYDGFRHDLTTMLDAVRCQVAEDGLDAREFAFHAVVALADETAGTSDWEWADEWRRDPLQVQYFGNLLAGEQFFDRLDELRPGADDDLLEVYYVCLCAGFRGMFHDDQGTLESRRRRLYQQLSRGDLRDEKYLTAEAYGRHLERSLARTRLPLWWMAPFVLGAIGLYAAYYWVLRQQASVLIDLAS